MLGEERVKSTGLNNRGLNIRVFLAKLCVAACEGVLVVYGGSIARAICQNKRRNDGALCALTSWVGNASTGA